FGFANLGALQVANLGRNFVKRRSDDSQRREIEGVTVALDHLRRDGRNLEAEPLADLLLELWLQVSGVADRARQLAHTHLLGRKLEARDVALHLGVPVRQLQPKGDRLGVNAMRPPDCRSVLELEGAPLQYLAKFRQVLAQNGRGLLYQQC